MSAKRAALTVIQDERKKSAKNNLSNEQKNILEKKYILHYFLKGYLFFLKKESLSIVEIALINTVLYFFWERKKSADVLKSAKWALKIFVSASESAAHVSKNERFHERRS